MALGFSERERSWLQGFKTIMRLLSFRVRPRAPAAPEARMAQAVPRRSWAGPSSFQHQS